jgi:hypothetical protein
MTERRTYEQKKIGMLMMMYDFRAGKVGRGEVMPYASEDINWAYGEGEHVILTGIALMIRNMVYLILDSAACDVTTEAEIAGRARIRAEIQSVLDETPLDQLLADIPEDEARDIRYDLERLSFIPPVMSKPWLNLSN